MKVPANCRLIGRWRIVEADPWDRAHLDLCGPARLSITARGGEIAFGGAALERDSTSAQWAVGCGSRTTCGAGIVWDPITAGSHRPKSLGGTLASQSPDSSA